MQSVRILGTGSYVPPKILSNFDIQKMGLDTSDEWIVKRTGVSERRIADPDVTTSDLAREAALQAFDMAGITAKDVDLILDYAKEVGASVPVSETHALLIREAVEAGWGDLDNAAIFKAYS